MTNKYENKDILHVKHDKLEYIQFKKLIELGITHCITLKHGGVSNGDRASLNFRLNGKDKSENVFENMNIISNEINIPMIYKGLQAHTDNVIILDNNNKVNYEINLQNKENIDGYIVRDSNIATLITTADCNPIIIYDKVKKVVANIHSGWAGTIKRIYIKTIQKMINEFGCETKNMICCIGPAIKQCCFSSCDENFKNKFTTIWDDESNYIKSEKNKFHIDLQYLIKEDLKTIGVKEIIDANICTVCNSNDFFSYRVATKNKQDDYGCMATIVMIK